MLCPFTTSFFSDRLTISHYISKSRSQQRITQSGISTFRTLRPIQGVRWLSTQKVLMKLIKSNNNSQSVITDLCRYPLPVDCVVSAASSMHSTRKHIHPICIRHQIKVIVRRPDQTARFKYGYEINYSAYNLFVKSP
jgi:hypothetical protein